MKDNPEYLINFISCVRKHECLWNSALKKYCKRELTDQAWREIALELDSPESECRERWKNIRCAFVRSLRLYQNGSGRLKKAYYLHDYLKFLLPHTNSKHGHDFKYETIEDGRDTRTVTQATSAPECDSVCNPRKHPLNEYEVFEKRFKQEETNKLININEGNWQNSRCFCSSNLDKSDIIFLNFISIDIKKLDEKVKRKFRKNVLNTLDLLIEEAETAENEEQTK